MTENQPRTDAFLDNQMYLREDSFKLSKIVELSRLLLCNCAANILDRHLAVVPQGILRLEIWSIYGESSKIVCYLII